MVRMAGMTLTSWARQAIATRSAWRRMVIRRQPTTSASARSCVSSARAGALSNSADGPRRLALAMLGQVPDVPLVDAEADPSTAGPRRTVGIHDRRDAFDHPIEVRRAGEVVVNGLVRGRVVVGVQ